MGIEGESIDSSVASVGKSLLATVNVRCSNSFKFSDQIMLDATVGAFKTLLAEKSDIPMQQQRLIYKGQILKDEQTLESYGLESDHTVHLVRGAVLSTASTNSSSNLGTSTTGTTAAAPRDSSSIDGGDFGDVGSASPLFPELGTSGLFGIDASGLFGFGFPEFDQV
ncbi:Ubiquitin [Dendrobium catenatum]|uniref:Ubiquitin n=1 Tax=Dendrobium catenatum TaxID=906689 RepID=A0A2I0VVF3_9ASPA|nr:Ubiquitin [Dendrobium catenatum]